VLENKNFVYRKSLNDFFFLIKNFNFKLHRFESSISTSLFYLKKKQAINMLPPDPILKGASAEHQRFSDFCQFFEVYLWGVPILKGASAEHQRFADFCQFFEVYLWGVA
jgi:hypothetical protein